MTTYELDDIVRQIELSDGPAHTKNKAVHYVRAWSKMDGSQATVSCDELVRRIRQAIATHDWTSVANGVRYLW